ncbi:MAG TPA: TIGR03435 family protein [Vicinamibacterales bacterium]|nr:TIGR03435 family protein [Vicinamibacterales bacterium]
MFERFTERARRVLFFARYECSQLGNPSIETEHLLLGLLREGKGVTSRLFTRAGLAVDELRQEIEQQTTTHEKIPTSAEIPFSPAAKRVLRAAEEEADRLLHHYIGTEHLLLGLLRDDTTVACRLLNTHGIQLEKVREAIVLLLNEHPAETAEQTRSPVTGSPRLGLHVSLMSADEPAGRATTRRADQFAARGFTLRELLGELLHTDARRIDLPPDLDGPQRYECALHVETGLPVTDLQVIQRLTHHLGISLTRERRPIDAYVLSAPRGDSLLRRAAQQLYGGSHFGSMEFSTVAGVFDARSPGRERLHSIGPVSMSGGSMADLATTLEEFLQRPVVDQTGLPDRYDIQVVGTYSGIESFLAALQDQLGLAVTSGHPEVEIIVVRRNDLAGG